jgi:hypothetical protein
MLLAAIDDPFRIMGSHNGSGHVQVVIIHTLEGGQRVDVNSSNVEISGLSFARDPREGRAMAALRFYLQTAGELPVTVEEGQVDLRVASELVRFDTVRCGTVWVADASVGVTYVRVEASRIDTADVQLTEVPEARKHRSASPG